MGLWDIYEDRANAHGRTKREVELRNEQRMLFNKTKNTLSYFEAIVDGEVRNVSIIDSDNLNEKKMLSLPGEDFDCGTLVEWADNYWLITEKDAHNEVYTRVKLLQCNYLLKWVDEFDEIHEQWCVIEDGTKYLTGELEDRNFVTTRGDSRIAMSIGKNEHTSKFGRNHRFIVDDMDSQIKQAFLLTKPLKVGHTYGGKGYYSFVLQEVVTTENDNLELNIADYYKHFPNPNTVPDFDDPIKDNTTSTGKKVWL